MWMTLWRLFGKWYSARMSKAEEVIIPLINPNESEAKLVSLDVRKGQKVSQGSVLGTLESTKSTFELTAPVAGFVHELQAKEGRMMRSGELFCIVAESKDWKPAKGKSKSKTSGKGLPEGLRITQPALKLAEAEGLALDKLPIGPVVTEALIRDTLAESPNSDQLIIPENIDAEKSILVYGGGGHGKAVIELIRAEGKYRVLGVIDDGRPSGSFVLDVPILGGGKAALVALHKAGANLAINAVGGIGAIDSRIQVFEKLIAAGYSSPALVHPSAVVEPSAMPGAGAQIFAQTYIGSSAKLGSGVIVNTGAIVSHDCEVKDYANLAPGAILAGNVHIGEASLIGMGVTINLNVKVGQRSRIGNSAVIKSDVPKQGIVRAGAVWPN